MLCLILIDPPFQALHFSIKFFNKRRYHQNRNHAIHLHRTVYEINEFELLWLSVAILFAQKYKNLFCKNVLFDVQFGFSIILYHASIGRSWLYSNSKKYCINWLQSHFSQYWLTTFFFIKQQMTAVGKFLNQKSKNA